MVYWFGTLVHRLGTVNTIFLYDIKSTNSSFSACLLPYFYLWADYCWFEFKNRSHSEKGRQIHQSWYSRRRRQISTETWAIKNKTSGHNSWVQSQRHTRFTNTVQYLVQACRPTRELTTEHELVRSVVPSTSVSWCVWHIDHARHLWNLTRVSQAASHISHTTRTRHLHRHTLSPYAQILYSTYIFNHNPVPNGWCSYETYSLINVMNDFNSFNAHSEVR